MRKRGGILLRVNKRKLLTRPQRYHLWGFFFFKNMSLNRLILSNTVILLILVMLFVFYKIGLLNKSGLISTGIYSIVLHYFGFYNGDAYVCMWLSWFAGYSKDMWKFLDKSKS